MTTPTPGDMSARLLACAKDCDFYSPDQCATLIDGIGWISMRELLTEAAAALSALPAAGGSGWWEGIGFLAMNNEQWVLLQHTVTRDQIYCRRDDHAAVSAALNPPTTPQPSAAEDGEERARRLYEPDEYEDAFKGRADAAVGAQGDDDSQFGPVTDVELGEPDPIPRNLLAAPAAGKGVDAHARELLAVEYERGELFEVATIIRRGNIPAGWKDDCIALRAISAALTRQPVAGDGMVLVPRKVTHEMLLAFWTDVDGVPPDESLLTDGDLAVLQREWNNLIAAAPAATPTDGGEGKS